MSDAARPSAKQGCRAAIMARCQQGDRLLEKKRCKTPALLYMIADMYS
jgi:hypothetical protein